MIVILIHSLRSLRLCEILFLQSIRPLAKTPRSPRNLPFSGSHRHSQTLFALFPPLRDSFPPVSRFSRQDAKIAKKFRLVTVIPILIPSLRSLRLCEILSLQLAASLAKTPRSPRDLPIGSDDRHSQPLFALFAPLRDSFPPVNGFTWLTNRFDRKKSRTFLQDAALLIKL